MRGLLFYVMQLAIKGCARTTYVREKANHHRDPLESIIKLPPTYHHGESVNNSHNRCSKLRALSKHNSTPMLWHAMVYGAEATLRRLYFLVTQFIQPRKSAGGPEKGVAESCSHKALEHSVSTSSASSSSDSSSLHICSQTRPDCRISTSAQ